MRTPKYGSQVTGDVNDGSEIGILYQELDIQGRQSVVLSSWMCSMELLPDCREWLSLFFFVCLDRSHFPGTGRSTPFMAPGKWESLSPQSRLPPFWWYLSGVTTMGWPVRWWVCSSMVCSWQPLTALGRGNIGQDTQKHSCVYRQNADSYLPFVTWVTGPLSMPPQTTQGELIAPCVSSF
jgi:hypothetical protein